MFAASLPQIGHSPPDYWWKPASACTGYFAPGADSVGLHAKSMFDSDEGTAQLTRVMTNVMSTSSVRRQQNMVQVRAPRAVLQMGEQ